MKRRITLDEQSEQVLSSMMDDARARNIPFHDYLRVVSVGAAQLLGAPKLLEGNEWAKAWHDWCNTPPASRPVAMERDEGSERART